MRIFIGSSSMQQSKKDLNELAMLIEANGHEPVPWNETGVFPIGYYNLEALRDISLTVGAAILIFNEDEKLWYRDNYSLHPNYNVVLEYGLFFTRLGRENTIICRRGNTTIPSDLSGIIYCDLDQKFKAQNILELWLQNLHNSVN